MFAMRGRPRLGLVSVVVDGLVHAEQIAERAPATPDSCVGSPGGTADRNCTDGSTATANSRAVTKAGGGKLLRGASSLNYTRICSFASRIWAIVFDYVEASPRAGAWPCSRQPIWVINDFLETSLLPTMFSVTYRAHSCSGNTARVLQKILLHILHNSNTCHLERMGDGKFEIFRADKLQTHLREHERNDGTRSPRRYLACCTCVMLQMR